LQDGRTFQIKAITGKHENCPRLHDNPMANSRWVSKKLLPDMVANRNLDVATMKKYLMQRYYLQLKPHVVRRARVLMLEVVEGRHDTSYLKLVSYIEMIRVTNPGSHAYISWDKPSVIDHNASDPNALNNQPQNSNVPGNQPENPKFKRLFISFKGCIDGFKRGCRPLIGVDGCHLRGPYKGVLLTAHGLDAENHCFPLAFAVVE